MAHVQINAPSGLYLGFAVLPSAAPTDTGSPADPAPEPQAPVALEVTLTEGPFPLLVEDRPGPSVVLRHPFSGHFITPLSSEGRLAAQPEEHPSQYFRRISVNHDSTIVVLQAADGVHYLSEESPGRLGLRATDLKHATIFRTEQLPEDDDIHAHGCCSASLIGQQAAHTEGGVRPLWDTGSHERLLEATLKLLWQHKETEELKTLWGLLPGAKVPKGRESVEELYTGSGGSVYRGLYDADYEDKYTDPVVGLAISRTYRTHFYDPDTRTNYLARNNPTLMLHIRDLLGLTDLFTTTEITALTEGQAYFNLAVHHGRRLLREDRGKPLVDSRAAAGHYLGLFIHFLTDLAQPMHASNYTALDTDWRGKLIGFGTGSLHSRFESELDKGTWPDTPAGKIIAKAGITKADLTAWTDRRDTSMGVFLHETVAKYSKGWLDRLPDAWRCLDFSDPKTHEFLFSTLRLGPNHIARGLMAWLHCSKQPFPLRDDVWYRIGELTEGEILCPRQDHRDYLGRWKESAVSDEDKSFCVVFNSDGTCSLVIKHGGQYKRVTASKHATATYFKFTETAAGKPETSFRVVPGLNGHLWLYWGDEALSSWSRFGWPGYARSWRPLHGMMGGACGFPQKPSIGQVFKFESIRSLNEAEKKAIPGWGKYDEWGQELLS